MRYHTISAAELDAELEGPRKPFLVDVRTRDAYLAGHLPGSVHIRVYDLGHERKRLPSSTVRRIVLIGEPGKRTEAGATFLTLMGYGDVAILDGGVEAWSGELETGEPADEKRAGGPELRLLPRDEMDAGQTSDEPSSKPSDSSS